MAATAAAVLLGRGRAAFAGRNAESGSDVFLQAYAAVFSDPRSAVAIGQRYLALHPAEADVERLKASLFDGLDVARTAALRARLAEGRRRDFASGRTVIVDGWILARTELRACALLTLLPQA